MEGIICTTAQAVATSVRGVKHSGGVCMRPSIAKALGQRNTLIRIANTPNPPPSLREGAGVGSELYNGVSRNNGRRLCRTIGQRVHAP